MFNKQEITCLIGKAILLPHTIKKPKLLAGVQIQYRITVQDKNNRVVCYTSWRTSHSFVANFLRMMYSQMAQATLTSVTDVLDAVYTLTHNATNSEVNLTVNVAALDDAFGIQTGTGTTAEGVNNTKLATKIAHGTGAGQLSYGAITVNVPAVTGSNTDMVITRSFTNSSGASITINEIGLVFGFKDAGNTTRYFLGIRDVITATAVANGNSVTIEYKLRTTN